MAKITLTDVLEMPVAERILLVEDIWDSLTAMPEAVHLTAVQREEFERRLDDYHRNPELGAPWQDVQARIPKRA